MNWYNLPVRRFITLLTTICLAVWIMPLGAFIKPSQEKIACDGQRPFHMCRMMSGKVRPDNEFSSKISFSNASNVNAQAKSAASAGTHFSAPQTDSHDRAASHFAGEFAQISIFPLILRSIEHVPKT